MHPLASVMGHGHIPWVLGANLSIRVLSHCPSGSNSNGISPQTRLFSQFLEAAHSMLETVQRP